MKTITKRIMAATLSLTLMVTSVCGGIRMDGVAPEVKSAKAAESTGRYVADIKISHASSMNEAQKELGSQYIILDRDFNDRMDGNCWIGYTTTDNPDMAITDIRTMAMDGKYSESDYKTLLDNHRETMEEQLGIFISPIIEYAKNYDAGQKSASLIHTFLNVYREDDSERNMGDLLLDYGRAFEKDRDDKASRESLKKILIEGNNTVIKSIEDLLTKAQDTNLAKKGSWLTRMSLLGPDGLTSVYKKAYPGKTKSYLRKMMENDLGETAQMLIEEMSGVRSVIRDSENSDLAKVVDDDAALDEMVSEATTGETDETPLDSESDKLIEAECNAASIAADIIDLNVQTGQIVLTDILKDTPYGANKSMYDFFMDEDVEKSDFYTMAYALSDGQKSIINDIGLYPVFESILSEYNETQEADTDEDIDISDIGEGTISVYDGIDRGVFDGDTAITADTLKNMETRQIKDVLAPNDTTLDITLAVGTMIAGAIFTAFAIRSLTKGKIYSYEKNVKWTKKITEKTRNLLHNYDVMLTYDNAWKIEYIKGKYGMGHAIDINFDLSSVKIGEPGTKEAISKVYKDAVAELKKGGRMSEKIASEVELMAKADKKIYLDLYKNNITNSMYQREITWNKVSYSYSRGTILSRALYILGAVAAFAFAGYEIYLISKKSSVDFSHIPANMMYRTYGDDVRYITYHAVTDMSGDATDIHDKKGLGWQVLYTTTDSAVGDPILASTIDVKNTKWGADNDVMYVSNFDSTYPTDLADDTYTGAKTKDAYISYKTGAEPEEDAGLSGEVPETPEDEGDVDTSDEISENPDDEVSSVFGYPGTLWILLAILVIAGGAAGLGIYVRKRKKSE